jgi:hypothetical protein
MFRAVLLATAFAALISVAHAQPVDSRNPVFSGTGVVVGKPTGGNLGPGTINTTGVYVNGQAVAGGLSVPNACVIGGTGTALSGVTLGTNLSCTNGTLNATGGGAGGTVTSAAVATANGFSGTVANPTTTPTITITVPVTGLLKGNGTGVAAAIAGTDFLAPGGSGAGLTGLTFGQLPTLSANQLLGGLTATTPAGISVPSCSGASNALIWTSGTGFGCNTISGSGISVPSAPLLSGNGTTLGAVTAINSIPIGGTTPAAGAFTALNGTGSTSIFGFPGATANLGSGGATSITDGSSTANFQFTAPTWDPDNILTITNNLASGNTLALRNTNNGGFSALITRDMFNNEVGAFHADNSSAAVVTGHFSGTTFTVDTYTSGNIGVGQTIAGAGVTVGTFITANAGGSTTGTGAWTVNNSQTISTEALTLYSGGTSFESSCLAAPAAPCAQPPLTDFRQTWQAGGALTFNHFMLVDQTNKVRMNTASTCNGGGTEDGMDISNVGYVGVCSAAVIAGVAFDVYRGATAVSADAAGRGSDAIKDLNVFNGTAPTIRMEHPALQKIDITLNASPNRLDFVATDQANTPFSICLDATKCVNEEGTTRYSGAVSSAPTTGSTVTFAATQRLAIIAPAGTLAALTVQLPACASTNDGDERSFLTTQALTAMTISAAAGSIGNGAATSAVAGSGHAYHCLGSATTWYQMY